MQHFQDLSFLIDTWEKELIYASTFIEKLRNILLDKVINIF